MYTIYVAGFIIIAAAVGSYSFTQKRFPSRRIAVEIEQIH
jgi:hypothetical protein